MMDKYRKNFILCGDIDHYCLLCQELFQGIPDVEKHIRWEKHRKSLKNQALFPRFRKELIYKVANHFYCEICNFVVPDIATVTEHINNDRHKSMKNNEKTATKNFIGHYDSGYIVINKVILDMSQWNSIVDKKCLVCNIEVQNIDEHLAFKEHIINLIQSETKYKNERYYRKINEDKYHCFFCKKVFSASNFNDHWPNCENIDEIEIKKLKEEGSSKSIETPAKDTAKMEVMEELHKQLVGSLQVFFFIDEKNNFAICKYCKSVVIIDFKSMLEHLKIKHDEMLKTNTKNASSSESNNDESSEDEVVYKEVIDYGKRRSELKKYGKENSIKLNFNGGKGWCLLCDRYISAHKNTFKQHIEGATHRGNLELQGLITPKEHYPINLKTKSILQCNLKYLNEEKEFYVNDYYSIDVYSFFLLRQIENDPHFKKTKCYACNELFPQGQEREHCETPKHKNKFLAAKFVIPDHEDEEFVRQIRPNYFHCGFCNKTFPFMGPLNEHKTSYKHEMLKERKTDCYYTTIKFNTKSDDVYLKLLHYGFGII